MQFQFGNYLSIKLHYCIPKVNSMGNNKSRKKVRKAILKIRNVNVARCPFRKLFQPILLSVSATARRVELRPYFFIFFGRKKNCRTLFSRGCRRKSIDYLTIFRATLPRERKREKRGISISDDNVRHKFWSSLVFLYSSFLQIYKLKYP
jgi:hypothetical protein